MAPTLLLALLLSTKTIPLPLNDVGATAVTNYRSTLVAWTNEFGGNPVASRVFIRLMDSPFDRNAVSLGSGFAPHIAFDQNSRDYLVGWSARGTRATAFRSDNAVVQLVSPEGVPGVRKVLNHSVIGGVTAIGRNQRYWIVAYYFEQGAEIVSRVVLLDEALNVTATIDTGKGQVRVLRYFNGLWWAFRTDDTTVTEAIRIREDGTAGQRFTTDAIAGPLAVTYGSMVLVLVQHDDDLDAIPFHPDDGFGARRPFLPSATLLGIQPVQWGSMLLLTKPGQTQYDAAYVDYAAELRTYGPLFFSSETQYPYASLGTSLSGPLFFFSPALPDDWATGAIDLYVYRLHNNLSPFDPLTGERVSQVTAPNDRRRAARH